MKERSRYSVEGFALVPAFSVPLLFFPAIEQCDMAAERLCQVRDGTLTAMALELYHRRHGDWPETLEQLVPRDLPEVPLDRFTGQALRYRIQDGRPLVYACGMDQQDDGGRHPSLLAGSGDMHQHIFGKPVTPVPVGTGYDWVLFPRPRQSPQARE